MLHHTRTPQSDVRLGLLLALIAGGLNAGGFLLLGQYTGHMTGMVSSLADNLALQSYQPLIMLSTAFLGFMAGAGACSALINWARNHAIPYQYALPLCLEGILILAFTGLETRTSGVPLTLAIGLLCFIMGLQNATITKASGARIRTTHVTGMTTDIGIELGKLPFGRTDYPKLALLSGLLASFFLGGLIGAFGFQQYGAVFALPFGLVLLALTIPVLFAAPRSPLPLAVVALLLPLSSTLWAESDTFSLPGLSMPLAMPEDKPHALEVNDMSELQETRYHQKDPSPTVPPLDAMQVPLDIPTTIEILEPTVSPTIQPEL